AVAVIGGTVLAAGASEALDASKPASEVPATNGGLVEHEKPSVQDEVVEAVPALELSGVAVVPKSIEPDVPQEPTNGDAHHEEDPVVPVAQVAELSDVADVPKSVEPDVLQGPTNGNAHHDEDTVVPVPEVAVHTPELSGDVPKSVEPD
ncbi:hypothetical protein H0H93_004127, partial [Arthromyces matolae]